MKAKLGSIISESSGKVGGHYFQNTRSGLVLKVKPSRPTASTNVQYNQRIIFEQLVKQWRSFSQTIRNAWSAANSSCISGFHYFTSYNLLLIGHALPMVTTPPISPVSFQTPNFTEVVVNDYSGYLTGAVYFICNNGSNIAIAGCGGNSRINVSTDYGKTWVNTYFNTSYNRANSIMFVDGSTWLASLATPGIVLRSVDNGSSWSVVSGISDASQFQKFCYLGNGIVLLGGYTNGAIWRSTDYGASWSIVYNIPSSTIVSPFVNCDNGLVIVSGYPNGTLLRSIDYGLTWKSYSTLTGYMEFYSGRYLGRGRIILGMYHPSDILYSNDFGLTFKKVLSGFAGSSIHAMSEPLNDCIFAISAFTSHLYVTYDGGLHWSDLGTPVNTTYYTALSMLPNGVLKIGGYSNGYIQSMYQN